jgi:hypothetical protein
MHASIRRYAGIPGLAEKLASRGKDIEAVIRGTPGFVAYYLVKTAEGAISVTLCETAAGVEASNKIAADWLKQHMPSIPGRPPEIYAGDVLLKVSGAAQSTRS